MEILVREINQVFLPLILLQKKKKKENEIQLLSSFPFTTFTENVRS